MGDDESPSPGAAYMTVYVRAATAYQMSNWWTKLVEKNRQSVLTVKLDGTVAGTHFSQTKLGDPIELRKNDSMVDLGHSEIVVERLPTTFSGMTFNLEIDKTATCQSRSSNLGSSLFRRAWLIIYLAKGCSSKNSVPNHQFLRPACSAPEFTCVWLAIQMQTMRNTWHLVIQDCNGMGHS